MKAACDLTALREFLDVRFEECDVMAEYYIYMMKDYDTYMWKLNIQSLNRVNGYLK